MEILQPGELRKINKAIAQREYYDFLLQAWPIFEPTTDFVDNWHIRYLCNLLQTEVTRIINKQPKTKDIIINVPPRSLKSTITTVLLNAWAWTNEPSLKFLTASYSGDLAVDLALKTRRLIESPWYQDNWGESVTFASDQNVKSRYENTKGGSRKSTGVGGGITGSGGDIIIIDDPISPIEAHSEVELKNCIDWFKETMYSRLNDQKIGLRILIMQRLHENDLTGWILKNQGDRWTHICLPATDAFPIVPEELSINYDKGLFFPARFGNEILKDSKTALGSYGYSGQMGQQPVPDEGGIFKREWFNYYHGKQKSNRKIWVWDTAVKTGDHNAYTAGILIAENAKGFLIEKVFRARIEYPELKRTVKQLFISDPAQAIVIEDKSSGQELLQDLCKAKDRHLPVIAIEAHKDKITRANMISPTVESGKIFLPEGESWVSDFIHEVTFFPNSTYADQTDAFVHGITYFLQRPYIKSDEAIVVGGKRGIDEEDDN